MKLATLGGVQSYSGTLVSGQTTVYSTTVDPVGATLATVFENTSPVLVPVTSTFERRGATGNTIPSVGYTDAVKQRQLYTEVLRFNVHVWGAADPPDPEYGDFDATRLLYATFIQAVHLITVGAYLLQPSPWPDQRTNQTQVDKLGTQMVLGMTVDLPVLDNDLSFVLSGTAAQVTLNYSGASPVDDITFQAGSA